MISSDIIDLVEKGVKLAYKKMLEEKSKNDEEIVISENGKIIRLKAKDVLNQLNQVNKI